MNEPANRYCIFDVETPNRANDRISSISVLVLDDGQIIFEKSCLVNPETDFDDFNTGLTGISADDVKDAPAFPQVWGELSDYFYSSIVVAHNAPFDLSVLRKCLMAYGLPTSDIIYICTYRCSKRLLPDMPDYQLPTLCAYFEIRLKHHQSQSDTRACAEILRELLALDSSAVDACATDYSLTDGHSMGRHGAVHKVDDRPVMELDVVMSVGGVFDIAGKKIVLTGEFDRGPRSNVGKELTALGATIQSGVTRKTDYVVVGGKGSGNWSAKNAGNKVKRAIEYNQKGQSIQIIKESDFFEGISLD